MNGCSSKAANGLARVAGGSVAAAWSVARQHLSFVVILFGFWALAPSATAQANARCLDQPSGDLYECVYRPQVVEPWQYSIPGPIAGINPVMSASAAKSEYGGKLAAACPTCCEPGTLINESSAWVPWMDVFTWNSDWPNREDKALTYRQVQRATDGTCLAPWQFTAPFIRERTLSCELPWAKDWAGTNNAFCRRFLRNKECRVGNPIAFPSGSKVFTELDYRSPSGLAFVRDFRADGASYPPSNDNLWLGLGQSWTHNYAGFLFVLSNQVWVQWGPLSTQYFDRPLGSPVFPASLAPRRRGQQVKLVQLSSSRYAYTTAANELVIFDVVESLSIGQRAVATSLSSAAGARVTLTPSPAGVLQAQDDGGRALQFQYDGDGVLLSVTDPASQLIRFDYRMPPMIAGVESSGREYRTLERVTFQDGKFRQYGYPSWGIYGADKALATRITSVVDELGVHYETIVYDAGGYVKSTELAGGVDRYSVNGSTVVDPLGTSRSYSFNEERNPVNTWQAAGAGCSASMSHVEYDTVTGNATSRDDFNGNRICYAYDTGGRNVELTRVEGLSSGQICSAVIGAGATLPAASRKISTQWHPDWRFETRRAEPAKLTTWVYNGQPDPFNGGATASCAPAGALLPDGKPIAVLCKQVEQATTDADGGLGFSATLQAGVANRVQQRTYNLNGQVLTAKGARSDVNDTTTFAYYASTTSDYTIGDLSQLTNAALQTTQFPKYNKHGQVLRSIDPNGVVTDNTYDLRLRLTSTTVGGQLTVYEYDPAGQLIKLTLPDTTTITYTYDPAHRLTKVTDHAGNSVTYTLDNAGNRIQDQIKDPSGTLTRTITRAIDALSRVQLMTGAAN